MFYGIVTRAAAARPDVPGRHDRRPASLAQPVRGGPDGALRPGSPPRIQLRRTARPPFCSPSGSSRRPMPVSGECSTRLAGPPSLFAPCAKSATYASVTVNTLSAVEMNVRRFHKPGFTNFEGRLENPRNIEISRKGISCRTQNSARPGSKRTPAAIPVSRTSRRCWRSKSPSAPELETDYGRRGTLVHDVLADLHRPIRRSRNRRRTAGDSSRRRDRSVLSKTAR